MAEQQSISNRGLAFMQFFIDRDSDVTYDTGKVEVIAMDCANTHGVGHLQLTPR